jgi:hypothetical protein
MSQLSFLTDQLAKQQIADRVAAASRSRLPVKRRPHGRHALAQHLHRIADRVDL